ncbi:MAG: hypothetical protein JKY50_01915 [Oleispira sp.]|nr:hypothetical protein [Oleispira sp.]MBL4879873.1 hypothetical protein [Oleispira sp.]
MLMKISSTIIKRTSKSLKKVNIVELATLTTDEKKHLSKQIFSIYHEHSNDLDYAEFCESFLQGKGVRVCLFYGEDHEIIGFINVTILSFHLKEYGKQAIFCAGAFFKSGYSFGNLSALYGLSEFVRFKFFNWNTPISYMLLASNPVVYATVAANSHSFYPSLKPMPDKIHALLMEGAKVRSLIFNDQGKYLVKSQATPRRAISARTLKRLENDPYAKFYLDCNPDYMEGKAVLVWIELNLTSLIVGIGKSLKNLMTRSR